MNGCQWIEGDVRSGAYSYCGKKTCGRGSGSWCPDHAAVVYEKPRAMNLYRVPRVNGSGFELRGARGLGFEGGTLGPSGSQAGRVAPRFSGGGRTAGRLPLDPAVAKNDRERRFIEVWNTGGSKEALMGVWITKANGLVYKVAKKLRLRKPGRGDT